MPHYAIHHNADYYPQPYSFVPERWISGAETAELWGSSKEKPAVVTDQALSRAQGAFCPFSVGPRGCIGKGLAYVEMMNTLARLLFLYDMRKAVGVADPGEGHSTNEWGRHRESEFQLTDTFTSLKNGPMVEFREVARET